jgi:predicted permease
VLGRIGPDASISDVQAGLDLAEVEPRQTPEGDVAGVLRAVPLRDVVVDDVRTQLTLLLGAVGCVLLVTCANVASLLLARASGRRDELATRAALGATRGRLVRQSLTEALVISAAGSALGLLLALWTVPLIIDSAPTNIPRLDGVGANWRTLVFSTTAAAAIGLCCGLLSALTADRRLALQSSTGRATPRVGRLRQGLAVAEIAVALVLVVGASLMVRTVRALGAVDLGFDPSQVISTVLPGTPQEQAAAMERVRALPGVVTAGVGGGPLDGGGMFLGGLTIPADPRELDTVRVQPVTPGYLEALSVRLLAGRLFEERDLTGDSPSPIVINRTTARDFFGEIDAVGRTLMNGENDPQVVVGVIADLREASLEVEPGPGIYQVATRSRNFGTSSMVIKLIGDPNALVPPIRSIVRSIDPEVPFRGVTPLQDNIDREMAPRRFVLQLIGLFSLLGLGLAVIGVYAVIAESVTPRVPEIGVRVAFGATTGNVVRLVLGQGWRLAAIGVPLGLIGAAALNGTMRAQVYGVSTLDPMTYAVAALCLIIATAAACLFPALRAARLDSVAALRAE